MQTAETIYVEPCFWFQGPGIAANLDQKKTFFASELAVQSMGKTRGLRKDNMKLFWDSAFETRWHP